MLQCCLETDLEPEEESGLSDGAGGDLVEATEVKQQTVCSIRKMTQLVREKIQTGKDLRRSEAEEAGFGVYRFDWRSLPVPDQQQCLAGLRFNGRITNIELN